MVHSRIALETYSRAGKLELADMSVERQRDLVAEALEHGAERPRVADLGGELLAPLVAADDRHRPFPIDIAFDAVRIGMSIDAHAQHMVVRTKRARGGVVAAILQVSLEGQLCPLPLERAAQIIQVGYDGFELDLDHESMSKYDAH